MSHSSIDAIWKSEAELLAQFPQLEPLTLARWRHQRRVVVKQHESDEGCSYWSGQFIQSNGRRPIYGLRDVQQRSTANCDELVAHLMARASRQPDLTIADLLNLGHFQLAFRELSERMPDFAAHELPAEPERR
jgi:hypothetical protein